MIREAFIALVASLIVLLGYVSPARAQEEPTNGFIVNDSTVNLQTISYKEAVNVFLFMQRHWHDGNRIRVFVPPFQSASFRNLAQKHGMSTVTYYESIIAKQHSGVASFTVANREQSIPIQVGVTPYSIGYYNDTIAINTGIGVRVLSVTP